MDPGLTLITPGVANIERARQFHETLGFVKADGNPDDNGQIVFP